MKKGYRLADVCRKLDLQPYVLRYWATEFPKLGKEEGGSGAQRLYSDSDLALLKRIKRLLYEEGYTIAGAKKKIESDPTGAKDAAAPLFADEEPGATAATDSNRLDTPDEERIETLRQGVAAALDEARAILALLESE